MKKKFSACYSEDIAKEYVDVNLPFKVLSTALETQTKWENGENTGEVVAYKAWFIQKGTEPFKVKFTDSVKLPKFLSEVKCEVQRNVYFKAKGLSEVQKNGSSRCKEVSTPGSKYGTY